MRTTSKQKTSANEDQPLNSRYKYDIRVYLQGAVKALLKNNINYARCHLRVVINDLRMVKSPSQEASDISAIVQEADSALLAKKPVVAHSCMRLAIKELSSTS